MVAALGFIIGAIGAVSEGQAAKEAGIETAESLTRQKVRTGETALQEEKDFRSREKRLLASGRVAQAVSGTTDEGSPLLVASDLVGEIEEQAMRIRHGGELVQRRIGQQADISLRSGRRAESASAFRAGGSLLRGAGSMYGSSGGRMSDPTKLEGPGYTKDYSGNTVRVA